jgi:4-hydroxy-tetrahydrodipicolinate synthase
VLYNIPGRSAINMPVETVIKLAHDCPSIVGIKEASGSMDYTSQLLASLGANRFIVFSGDDSLTLPLMALGAKGVISVVANILPAAMSELCRSWTHGHAGRALELHMQLFPLIRALFIETNPAPVKAAMAQLKLCSDELRLPLVLISAESRARLLAALKTCPLVQS